jgi:hypothetical protein
MKRFLLLLALAPCAWADPADDPFAPARLRLESAPPTDVFDLTRSKIWEHTFPSYVVDGKNVSFQPPRIRIRLGARSRANLQFR